MRYLSLFSGVGGGDLAAQHLLGMECVGYVEWEEYPCRVLEARIADGMLDDAPIWQGDIREFGDEQIAELVSRSYTQTNPNWEADMPAHRKNYDDAVIQYNAGLSVGDVAQIHGVTRQAMYAILKRRGVAFRPQQRMGEDNHFYRGGSTADDRAQNLLEKAVERGLVERRNACESCGSRGEFSDGRTSIQAHHCDYNKPLDVMWLCQKCHHEWHKNHQAIAREEDVEPSGGIYAITAGFP